MAPRLVGLVRRTVQHGGEPNHDPLTGDVLSVSLATTGGRSGDQRYEKHHDPRTTLTTAPARLARAIFHGRRGELRQRYREGQEDQLGALGLVVNAVVLWNTRYLERTLDHLAEQGASVRAEDVGRLSPLGYGHVNLLGHPVGATSSILTGKSLYELQRSNTETALVTMCIGGQGIAAIFERLN